MTSSARPNLGGLFNGSTTPQQPSRITDPAGPRLVGAIPVQEVPVHQVPIRAAAEEPTAESVPPGGSGATAGWADPVNLVNQYFQFLRTLLDINQQWAVSCADAVAALPRRVGLRR